MANFFDLMEGSGAHRVLALRDGESGLRAFLVMDDVTLGPGCGGIRTQIYPSESDALADAVKLARAMTLKCAIAGLPAGGAKTVVLDHPGMKRAQAFRRLGGYIEDLGGMYRSAGDLGTTLEDLKTAAQETSFIDTTGERLGAATAVSVLNCLRACAQIVRQKSLAQVSIAVQGCGLIGAGVARMASDAGARVFVADVDAARARSLAEQTGAQVLDAEAVLGADVDMVAPCAVGGVITEAVASTMKAWAICGGANNQIADSQASAVLQRRGITFMPDFLASSGAVIDGVARSVAKVDPQPLLEATYDTAIHILEDARASGRSTIEIAEQIARERIANGKRRRRT